MHDEAAQAARDKTDNVDEGVMKPKDGITFAGFVRTRHAHDNARGDFIRDMRQDGDFPDVDSWADIRDRLTQENACAGAIEAARRLWKEYVWHMHGIA